MTQVQQNDPLKVLLDETLMLFNETADYHHRRGDIQTVMKEAQETVRGLRERLRRAESRYVVGVVGLSNVGKSTLLNALFGQDLAPRRNGPCTAAPVEFTYGAQRRVVVYRRDSLRRPAYTCASVEAVHQHLAELVDGADGEASDSVRRVEVQVSHDLLKDGLVIADTPGFGAVQQGDAAGSHEEALRRYLHEEVAQVFWVVLAEQGIGRREIQFHEQMLADVCDDVLVTGSEGWDARDRRRWRRRFADAFGGRLPAFHFVSGLAGVKARERGDAHALEEAGIKGLEARIRELAEPAGRFRAAEQQLCQLADDLAYWLSEYRDQYDHPLHTWWRPDSWGRWRYNIPDSTLKRALQERLRMQEIPLARHGPGDSAYVVLRRGRSRHGPDGRGEDQ